MRDGRKDRKGGLGATLGDSHEEDTGTEKVFRPSAYSFPRSRGRASFELKADGSLIETGIGPADRPQSAEGTWKLEDDKLKFYRKSQADPTRVLEVISADRNRLVIKK